MPEPIDAIRAEVARMKERAEKAPPGPWTEAQFPGFGARNFVVCGDEFDKVVAELHGGAGGVDGFRFIAAARSDVPRLVALVEGLCEIMSRVRRGACGRIGRHLPSGCGCEFGRKLDPPVSDTERVVNVRAALAKLTALTEETNDAKA